ncbi:hypothetical protein HDU79_001630 [Rhizoclosmatium sp. JEL0117]|nr:hypothetical protein HDU79_001630 [Rhizoclosmatium sp. JEL0117]
MSLSPTKCFTINYSGPALIYNNTQIANTNSHKYLGINISTSGPLFYQYYTGKIHQARQTFQKLSNSPFARFWHPHHRRNIFFSLIRSRWEYATPLAMAVLTQQQLSSLDYLGTTLINSVCQWIFKPFQQHLPLPVPSPQVRYLLGIQTYRDRANYLVALLAAKPPTLIPTLSPAACTLTTFLRHLPLVNQIRMYFHQSDELDLKTAIKRYFRNQEIHSNQQLKHIIFKPFSGMANVLKHSQLTAAQQSALVRHNLSLAHRPDSLVTKALAKNDLVFAYNRLVFLRQL